MSTYDSADDAARPEDGTLGGFSEPASQTLHLPLTTDAPRTVAPAEAPSSESVPATTLPATDFAASVDYSGTTSFAIPTHHEPLPSRQELLTVEAPPVVRIDSLHVSEPPPVSAEVMDVLEESIVHSAPFSTAAGLDAVDISAWFGSNKVLERVSLSMPPRTVTALIGPSGCGKSTFLRILNRMHESVPSAKLAGEVRLNGQDIYAPGTRITETRRRIGMVFQKPNPFPAMSIADNVTAGLKLTGTKASRSEKVELIERCLIRAGLWNEVKDRLNQPGSALSGGQQQRLCIARSLAVNPDVLLMDEPCSALDPTSTRRVEETIFDLAPDVTIVIVTHNMQQAARVSQQCAFFLAEMGTPGGIVEAGTTKQIFENPRDDRTSDYVNGRFG